MLGYSIISSNKVDFWPGSRFGGLMVRGWECRSEVVGSIPGYGGK